MIQTGISTRINDIAYYLPNNIVTVSDLANENPDWDMEQVEKKTGIIELHMAGEDETPLDMAVKACEKLLSMNQGLNEKIDAILFCSVVSDYLFPKNSYILQQKLKLPTSVFCLDIGLACSGFVYSLAVADGLIKSGVAHDILVVTAEALSRYINPKDRSAKCIFSDGAAVTWVSGSSYDGPNSSGIVDMSFGAMGKAFDAGYVPGGECRIPSSEETVKEISDASGNIRNLEQMHMDGKRLLALVGSNVPGQVRGLLKKNSLSINDIDLFIFHQASRLVLDSLERLLRIPPEKNFRNLLKVGNTSNSSIPIAMKDAIDQNRIVKGSRVIISSFGAGFSWGSAIIVI